VFEVKVYGEEELSGKYRIAEDGTINFPLVGPVAVGGKAQTAIAIAIQDALREKKILRNPNVSIFVAEYASRRVTVLGAVSKPGSVALKAGMTVVQAISEAGGFTPLASPNQTLVTRRVDGKLIRVTVAVEKVTEGRAEDIAIRSGDTIYVPERIF
jgi:protein involved in polysaccharide export with SLBB domain